MLHVKSFSGEEATILATFLDLQSTLSLDCDSLSSSDCAAQGNLGCHFLSMSSNEIHTLTGGFCEINLKTLHRI